MTMKSRGKGEELIKKKKKRRENPSSLIVRIPREVVSFVVDTHFT